MAQSYKKGRKFKTESPALLSITRGGRPAAAPPPPAPPPLSPPPHYPRLCAAVGIRSLCRSPHTSLCRCSHTSLCFCQHPHLCFAVGIRFPHLRSHPPSVLPSEIALCAAARTPLCAFASIPASVPPSASALRTSAPIPASVPPSAFLLWIVVGVRFLRRGKRGRAVPDKIGVVEILLKNRAPRGWNPANNS